MNYFKLNSVLTGWLHCASSCVRHYYQPYVSQYSRYQNKTSEIEFQLFSSALFISRNEPIRDLALVSWPIRRPCTTAMASSVAMHHPHSYWELTLLLVSGISPVSVFCATLPELEARRLPRLRPLEKLMRTVWEQKTERGSRARHWTTDSSHLQTNRR